MEQLNVVEISPYRKRKEKRKKPDTLNVGKAGRVYGRGGKLWVDFRYLGERVRERSGLEDTPDNRDRLRKQLDLILAEIANRKFEFALRFPHSKQKEHFTRLEGRNFTKDPQDIIFGDFARRWFEEMKPGMTENQIRDYTTALENHILPYFGDMPFSEMKPITIKKFLAHLKQRRNRYRRPLSPKTIRNYLIPLRVIVKDAVSEYSWNGFGDPFLGVKLPNLIRKRIQPFSYEEWQRVMEQLPGWYRPYFEFAVQTGLRPSEQVALKWSAVDDKFIYIERSRVRKLEKADLKTQESVRSIELRPEIRKTLERQRKLASKWAQPYVFVNSEGRPIQQENLGKIWRRALSKAGVPYRRMYETRHTFASWALGFGESPEWIARTMGHVDTTMVYRTYGRYIPNLTREDASAFEEHYAAFAKK